MSRRGPIIFAIVLCLLAMDVGASRTVRARHLEDFTGIAVVEEIPAGGGGFTASARLNMGSTDSGTRAIWLGSVGTDQGVLGLYWSQDPDDWFERWALRLVDAEGTIADHSPLGYLTPSDERTYDMVLTYDAHSGAVGFRLQDLATGAEIVGARTIGSGLELRDVGVQVEAVPDVHPEVQSFTVDGHFVPLGMSFRLLQRQVGEEKWSQFSFVDRTREAAVALSVPWGTLPGEGRLAVVVGGEQTYITIPQLVDGLLVPIDTQGWTLGTARLRLDYVREGESMTIEEKATPVGSITVSMEELAPITTQGKTTSWQGVLRLDSDGPVGEARVKLDVRRIDYRTDLPNGSETTRVNLVDTVVEFLGASPHTIPFTFSMETPNNPWSLALEPTVHTTSHVQGYVAEDIQELYYGRLPEEPTPVADDRLRIALYNIRYARGMDGVVDLSRVAQVLLDHEVDVVAFNEVDYGWPRSDKVDQPAVLSELLGMPHFYYMPGAQRFSPYLEGHGHAIMTHHSLASALGKYLPRLGIREFRGAIGAEIPLENEKALHVWVTHLAHGGNSTDAQLRLLQAEALIKLAGRNELGLIMGDMNAVPAEPATRAFLDAGWVDVWAKLGQGPGFTFPSDYPDRRIDYIYATPALAEAFVSIEIPRTTASDHLPIIAEIDVTRLR